LNRSLVQRRKMPVMQFPQNAELLRGRYTAFA